MTVALGGAVDGILEFASHLNSVLHQCQPAIPDTCPDVYLYINALPLSSKESTKSQKTALRANAVDIWNSCNLISAARREKEKVTVARLRTFAFLLLASITPIISKKKGATDRLFQNSLTVLNECLECDELGLAEKIVDHVSDLQIVSLDPSHTLQDHHEPHPDTVGYHCLRLLFEWKRRRPDLAERCYCMLTATDSHIREDDVEKIVDMFYEIAKECLTLKDHTNALKWLERAVDMLNYGDFASSFVTSDLRLSVLHSLVQTLSKYDTPDSSARAQGLLTQLREEYGPKLAIMLLSLEVVCKQPQIDVDTLRTQLEEMIHTIHIIEANHKVILHHVNKLASANFDCGSRCMQKYILHRLVPEGNVELIEQSIVNHIAMHCDHGSIASVASIQALQGDLDTYCDALQSGISLGASQAAHILVWRMIHETDNNGSRALAMLWGQIGLHRIFELAGEASTGKLERQMISYHLLIDDLGSAREILDEMSFMQKNKKHSRYLAYCVALRSQNDSDANSCLNTIINGQGDDDQLLFACVGESIKHNKSLYTARLLQRLLDRHGHLASPGLHLEALLKYTVKTLLEVVDIQSTEQSPEPEVLLRLSAVFRHVLRVHKKNVLAPANDSSAKRLDLLWFEEQSFEIARTHIKIWPKRYTIDLLQYSAQLCLAEHDETKEITLSDERQTRMRDANFMAAILYASEARNAAAIFSVEDLPETSYESKSKPKASECQLVLYRNVFKIFSAFHDQYQAQAQNKFTELNETQSQAHVLIPLAFEALLFMNASAFLSEDQPFDEISIRQFISTANELEPPAATYVLLADTVLAFANGESSMCSQLHGLQIPSISAARLLGYIVQMLRQVQEYNVEQAARWIRCIAQLLLENIEQSLPKMVLQEKPKNDPSLAMLDSVVKQALDLATSRSTTDVHAQEVRNYPPEELEWLATRLFNMAVDLCAVGQQKMAEQWTRTAIEVAKTINTGGSRESGLVEVLRKKIDELGWSVSVHE